MSRFNKYMDEMCGDSHGKKKRKRKGKTEDVNETSNDKKKDMYMSGMRTIRSAFWQFSQDYMKGMGFMAQGKNAVDPKWKKARDKIATAYERLDDAIKYHDDKINDMIANNLKNRKI